MTAVPIRIADAVAAQLNVGAAADAFGVNDWTAARRYPDWDDKFTDLSEETPSVDVVFRAAVDAPLDDQNSLDYMVDIDAAIRRRFAPDDRDVNGRLNNSAIDPLVNLLVEMHEYFVSRRESNALATEPLAVWQASSVKLLVDHKKLRQGLFYGWLRLTFQWSEDV
jgi:hypothetical protein